MNRQDAKHAKEGSKFPWIFLGDLCVLGGLFILLGALKLILF
jgi:hypothetical protein